MHIFFCSLDSGSFDLLVTTDENRAIQLFATQMVLAKLQAARMTIRELNTDADLGEFQEGLRDVSAGGVEAFLTYDLNQGWVAQPVMARFDALSAGQESSR